MTDLYSAILYVSIFTTLFFEVFLLITYLEVRGDIKRENAMLARGPKHFPTMTVIIPCFNEEKTVAATIHSVLALDYPQDKISFILVDDGSTDNTLAVLKSFEHLSNVRVVSKVNGGKHTAVNLGIDMTTTDLVACLDADSFVTPETLRNIVPYFDDPEIKAVVPSIKVFEPTNMLQSMQKNEYRWGVFLRRMLSSMGALYVTPGPFSTFRTSVYHELGGYKNAHLTEDMEMAMRLQKNGYKFVNSHSAHVYTVTPATIKTLLKQRVRWTYGFLNNVFDYREMLFNRKYGNIGMFIIPLSIFSIFFTPITIGNMIFGKAADLWKWVERVSTVGLNWHFAWPSFDWYFLNTGVLPFLMIGTTLILFIILFLAIRLADGKVKLDRGFFYYLAFYAFIVPLWLTKAIWNTIFRTKVTWR